MVFGVSQGNTLVPKFIKVKSNNLKVHLFFRVESIMFVIFFISNMVTLSAATVQETGAFFNVGADIRENQGLSNAYESLSKPILYNSTYMDKEENLLRIPNKYFEQNKTKKKIKKPPKRTVQKIIKKNKLKTRKLYLFPATLSPTLASKRFADELKTRLAISTTENNFKKRPRKNSKYARYSMPFQKLQRRDGSHTRYKRADRDVYILKDFDEIEFLSKEKDHDKVLTHVKTYW